MFHIPRKKKYTLLMFQSITHKKRKFANQP